jgi:hypothetical protein
LYRSPTGLGTSGIDGRSHGPQGGGREPSLDQPHLEDIQAEATDTKDGLEGVMYRFELENELFQMTSKRELKDEVAGVKSQMEDLENGDWP